jgi:hypothetical protein
VLVHHDLNAWFCLLCEVLKVFLNVEKFEKEFRVQKLNFFERV